MLQLQALALSWGGEVKEVPTWRGPSLPNGEIAVVSAAIETFRRTYIAKGSFSEAPFSGNDLGIVWEKKQVLFCGAVLWYEVVHEMAHVFACLREPNNSNEWDFFGWEYAMAKMLKGVPEWKAENGDYVVTMPADGPYRGAGRDFKVLTSKEQVTLIRDRVQVAKAAGLLDSNLKPKAIR